MHLIAHLIVQSTPLKLICIKLIERGNVTMRNSK